MSSSIPSRAAASAIRFDSLDSESASRLSDLIEGFSGAKSFLVTANSPPAMEHAPPPSVGGDAKAQLRSMVMELGRTQEQLLIKEKELQDANAELARLRPLVREARVLERDTGHALATLARMADLLKRLHEP